MEGDHANQLSRKYILNNVMSVLMMGFTKSSHRKSRGSYAAMPERSKMKVAGPQKEKNNCRSPYSIIYIRRYSRMLRARKLFLLIPS